MAEKYETITVDEFKRQFLLLDSRLKSYLFRLTANRHDAEDLAQESYLKALQNLTSFAGKSTLKTWIFTIATNLAKDNFKTKQRWGEDIQDRCRETTKATPQKVDKMRLLADNSPAEKYEFKEHIDYCFTCIAKTLEIEQQLALILKEVYDFKVAEIMEILAFTEGQVKYALTQARQTMSDIFDRRCELVNKNGACYQCSEINDFINPKQKAREKLMQLKLYREAQNGADKQRLFDLRAELVRSVDPLAAPGVELHAFLLELMPEHAE
jgi:RNA polymerase sigma-70 factor (ECF subfamily)